MLQQYQLQKTHSLDITFHNSYDFKTSKNDRGRRVNQEDGKIYKVRSSVNFKPKKIEGMRWALHVKRVGKSIKLNVFILTQHKVEHLE
jgi:hypothetical protein